MAQVCNDRQYEYFHRFTRAAGIGPNDWCFVCAYGLGDTYFVCALAMAFRQSGQMKPGEQLVVAVKRAQADIPALFPGFIDRVVAFDSLELEPLTRFGRFHAGVPHLCHPYHHGDGRLVAFLTKDGVHLLDLYRFLMGLPFDAQPVAPVVPGEARLSARARLEDWAAAGVPLPRRRTALLAPHAFSMNTLPAAFWQRLAGRLQAAGWAVALNRDPAMPMEMEGVPLLDYPLAEALTIAGHCGWLISARSGLCDLVSTGRVRQTVLYPRLSAAAEAGRRFHEFHAYSLRAMGLSPEATEIEVLIDGDWDAVIDRILASAPAA